MDRDTFDTELFIDEVEKRRTLWDMESPDYTSRYLKRRGWEEIVEMYCNPRDSAERKKNLSILLQKKWKGLRDSFVREMKKNNDSPSGSGAGSKNSYIYFLRLMFLEGSVRNKTTDANIEESPVKQPPPADCDDAMKPPSSSYSRNKKRKISAADAELMMNATEQDDDKLFCLSLHKELLKVPEANRLGVKIEIMDVLYRVQQGPHYALSNSYRYRSNENVRRYSRRGFNTRTPQLEHTVNSEHRSTTPSPEFTIASVHLQVNKIMAKPKKNLTKEEKLAKDRIRKREKFKAIKSNPELYALQQEKERKRYLMRKEDRKILSIKDMTPRTQREQRKNWIKNSRSYLKKKEEQKKIHKILIGNSPSECGIEENVKPEPIQDPLVIAEPGPSIDNTNKNTCKIVQGPVKAVNTVRRMRYRYLKKIKKLQDSIKSMTRENALLRKKIASKAILNEDNVEKKVSSIIKNIDD